MRNPDRQTTFRFRQFEVSNKLSAMKIGTDAVLLGAWAFEASGFGARSDLRALDIGCGTGVLSLMLAQRFAQWFTGLSVLGIDIDADAATEASANFSRSPWAARLEAFQVDFRSFAVSCEAATYDMIISNPPFSREAPRLPTMPVASHATRNRSACTTSWWVQRVCSPRRGYWQWCSQPTKPMRRAQRRGSPDLN